MVIVTVAHQNSAEQPARRRPLELRIPAPLDHPGEHADDHRQPEQHREHPAEFPRRQCLQQVEHRHRPGRRHRDRKPALEISVAEIHHSLGIGGGHDRPDRAVELAGRHSGDQIGRIDLDQPIGKSGAVGHPGKKVNADPFPAAPGCAHDERRRRRRADAQCRRRPGRLRKSRLYESRRRHREGQRERQPPAARHAPSKPVRTPTAFSPIASTA
ncbi:MAG: hypothetical protein QM699_15450 [Amaricoccus sp.]